jgi:TRAP-type C4-dicarboxylate transport system permease small subunit
MSGLLAWRTGIGAADLRLAGETTMILGFPLWLGYAAMLPGLILAALAAIHIALHDWRQSSRWQ